MKFEQEVSDTSYGKEQFTEKFRLMTHLIHSKLERNRKNVNIEDVESINNFIKNNLLILYKIKKSIYKEYDYKVSDFQVNVACCFFLNKKITK
jgi:hypothetical protein